MNRLIKITLLCASLLAVTATSGCFVEVDRHHCGHYHCW